MILLVFIRISDLWREEVTITGFLLSGFAALVGFQKDTATKSSYQRGLEQRKVSSKNICAKKQPVVSPPDMKAVTVATRK